MAHESFETLLQNGKRRSFARPIGDIRCCKSYSVPTPHPKAVSLGEDLSLFITGMLSCGLGSEYGYVYVHSCFCARSSDSNE